MTRTSLFLAAALVCFTGCRPCLSGSLTEVMPLDYDHAAIELGAGSFSVGYYMTDGSQVGVVLLLSVASTGLDLNQPGSVDLSERLPDGSFRATVTRAMTADPPVMFPTIMSGSLDLQTLLFQGWPAQGAFHLVFDPEQSGGDAAGRSVHGDFAVTPHAVN